MPPTWPGLECLRPGESLCASQPVRRIYTLPDTPVAATYGASVTITIRNWLIALSITFAALALIAFLWIMYLGMEEFICFDRSQWWGAPEDSNSTCSGLWYADKHPGEFPWTLPR
jgi:hypothetical protein